MTLKISIKGINTEPRLIFKKNKTNKKIKPKIIAVESLVI
jgi:hypothetical protein